MTTNLFMRRFVLTLLALFASASIALSAPTKKELQARFEQRYPQIRTCKTEGKVGETDQGFIEAVKSADGALSQLIEEENADRRTLYDLIAKEESITVDVVAKRAAQRNFQKAKSGEFLKQNGTWKQK